MNATISGIIKYDKGDEDVLNKRPCTVKVVQANRHGDEPYEYIEIIIPPTKVDE